MDITLTTKVVQHLIFTKREDELVACNTDDDVKRMIYRIHKPLDYEKWAKGARMIRLDLIRGYIERRRAENIMHFSFNLLKDLKNDLRLTPPEFVIDFRI